jgi:hypothetical protein
VMIRAFGSPKIPRTIGCARKPANEYVSQMRRRRFDALAIQNPWQKSHPEKSQIPLNPHSSRPFTPKNHPRDSTKTQNMVRCIVPRPLQRRLCA